MLEKFLMNSQLRIGFPFLSLFFIILIVRDPMKTY